MFKLETEYIASALGWGVIPNGLADYQYKKEFKIALLKLSKILNDHITAVCKNTVPSVGTLFNAYTEEGKVKEVQELDNVGMKYLYADSGGLQIITVGKEITEDIKKDIYKIQTAADYAFCFDVIPLRVKPSAVRSRNERSNIGNKVYDESMLEDCGNATGKNVKTQIDLFRELGAKTKVIIICQGNSYESFMTFYECLASQLKPEDYDYIGGIAIAKTTVGTGAMEAIEIIRAAKHIAKICHPAVKQQLHILGLGAISKIRPILYLMRSGYLTDYPKLSYDSSSHTSCFDYGLLKINGKCTTLGHKEKTIEGINHFKNVYELFSPLLSKLVAFDQFIDGIYGEDNDWAFAKIRARALEADKYKGIVAMLSKTLHTYYQIDNFCKCIDDVFSEPQYRVSKKSQALSNIAIGQLLDIKTEEDMQSWLSNHKAGISSNKISSKVDETSLDFLFE